MGQRLVINITSNGDILANAYYHWDAYTATATEHTVNIVSNIDKARKLAKQLLIYDALFPVSPETKLINLDKFTAYLILEQTGAGIEQDDEKEISKIIENYNYRKGNNRNEGLIAITPENMKKSIDWAEGTVDIDISQNEVKFDVFGIYTKEDLNDDDEIKQIDFNDLRYFKFSDIDKWSEKVEEMSNDTTWPYYQDKDNPDIYYTVIA